MHKLIIYSNDLELISKYCNNIFLQFNNLKLVGIANSEKDLSTLVDFFNPNIIFLAEKNKATLSSTLDKIENKIILCKNIKKYKNSKHNLYISENSNYLSIKELLVKFISNINENDLYQRIYQKLNKLNFDFKLSDTNYLVHAISYSYINKNDYLFENLEKKIYPYVAKKFNTSESNVKWSIVRSINNMNSKNNSKCEFTEKITSKALISQIVNSLD